MAKHRGAAEVRRSTATAALALVIALAGGGARAAHAGTPGPGPLDSEQAGVIKDRAAVGLYQVSINKLSKLAKQNGNTPAEPAYLLRIAESLYRVAALEFRLAHSSQTDAGNRRDLADYDSVLSNLSKLATRIITKFPRLPELPRVYFLRAQTSKELERDGEAVADLRLLLDTYPRCDDAMAAENSLYDLFTKAKDFPEAIAYLNRFDVGKSDKYYPTKMDHLAFAHYSLGEIPQALKCLKAELQSLPPESGADESTYSEREKVLLNASLFYFGGLERGMPEYPVQEFAAFLMGLKPGRLEPKLAAHFSDLLRSKGRADDLDAFRRSVLASQFDAPAKTEVLLSSIAFASSAKRYGQLREATDQLSDLLGARLKPENTKDRESAQLFEKTQRILSQAANDLHQTVLKTKDPREAAALSVPLVSLYNILLKTAGEADRRKIAFNLAELFFGLKRYEAAAFHYRWVADLQPAQDEAGRKLQARARFRSLACAYESLSQRGLLPKDLKAMPLDGGSPAELTPEEGRWLDWLDEYGKTRAQEDPADGYEFEASRLLYAKGRIRPAIERLRALLTAYPRSDHATAAVALILDTYVASHLWKDARDLASQYLKAGARPADAAFRAKLAETAGAASFKTIELLYKDKKYEESIAGAETFLKTYPTSAWKRNCLELAGNAALALKDRKRAMNYFAPLLNDGEVPAESLGTALLTSGAVAEDARSFASAAESYRRYLSLPPKSLTLDPDDLKQLRLKTLHLAWISSHAALLKAALNSRTVCVSDVFAECDRYSAYLLVMQGAGPAAPSALKRAYERADHSSEAARPAWAALALRDPKSFGLAERLHLLEVLSANWDKQDADAQLVLVPLITRAVPAALRQANADVRSLSRLALDKGRIDKRTQLIRRVQAVADKASTLPWSRIRVETLRSLADLYADFSADVGALPTPAGLSGPELAAFAQTLGELRAPLRKKSDDLRKQALALAMDSVIEGDSAPILGPEWLTEARVPAPFAATLTQALKDGNWGLVSFLIRDAKEKNSLSEGQLAAARALSLVLAGAQAEALGDLKEAANRLDPGSGRRYALAALVAAYYGVRAKDRTKAALGELEAHSPGSKEPLQPGLARQVADATAWSRARVPASPPGEAKNEGQKEGTGK